ncbi:MAG TPA: hypothetical protein VFO60_12135 [Candidatus Dormibacteraeota bacterium]|nr:hypothetical protein [Candidatus Dormibacteraeota bacterium]
MELDYALFADAASSPDRKLYILGGGFSTLTLPTVPGRAAFAVVAGFRFTEADSEKRFDIELRFVDAAGKLVIPPSTLQFQSMTLPAGSDLEVTVPTITYIQPTFGDTGRYAAEYWTGDRMLAQVRLRVEEAAPGALGPQPN